MLQRLDLGSTADDGTGTVLRDGGAIINANFVELDGRPWLAPVLETRNAPPPTLNEGARYLVGPLPVAAFVAHTGQIAEIVAVPGGLGWQFQTPPAGAVLWHITEAKHLLWNGQSWADLLPAPPVQTLPLRLEAIAALPVEGSGLLDLPSPTTANFVSIGAAARALLATVTVEQQRALLGLGSAAFSQAAQPGGVATLGADGKLSLGQLPDLAVNAVYVVASQAEMLALAGHVGDVAVRTDLNHSFILKQTPASTLGNWVELAMPPNAVLSVHGRTGVVAAQAGDYAAGQITVSPPVAGASDVQTALTALQAGATPTAGPGIKISGNVVSSDGVIFKSGALPSTASAGMAQIDHPVDRSDWVMSVQTPDGVRLFPSEGQMLAEVGAWLAGASTKELDRPLIQGYAEIVQGPLAISGTAKVPAPGNGNLSILTLTGDTALSLPTAAGPTDTAFTIHVLIEQDAVGNHALNWVVPSGDRLAWDGGAAPTLSMPANSVTLFVFTRWAALGLWLGARVFKEA